MDHASVKHYTVMVKNITSNNNMKHSTLKPEIGNVNNTASHKNMTYTTVKYQTVMVKKLTATTI
jgi:hypothetical protein